MALESSGRATDKQIYIINASRDKHDKEKDNAMSHRRVGQERARILDKAGKKGDFWAEIWVKQEWATWLEGGRHSSRQRKQKGKRPEGWTNILLFNI